MTGRHTWETNLSHILLSEEFKLLPFLNSNPNFILFIYYGIMMPSNIHLMCGKGREERVVVGANTQDAATKKLYSWDSVSRLTVFRGSSK